MKRILALTLSLAMLAGLMTVSAGAVPAVDNPYSDQENSFTNLNNAGNTGNTTVDGPTNSLEHAGVVAGDPGDTTIGTATGNVTINTGGSSDTTHVWAVTYNMPELHFTYSTDGARIWNPETLRYETTSGTGTWTGVSARIDVTNYSDLPVEVTATVNQTQETNVDLDIYAADATADADTATFTLASAADDMNNGVGTATTNYFTLAVSGRPNGSYDTTGYVDGFQIATVTLTVKDGRE